MEPRELMTHSQGLSKNPYPELNKIPRTDNYLFGIYYNIVLLSKPKPS